MFRHRRFIQSAVYAKTGAVAYNGPGDVVSFTAWWGLRAYSAAKAAALAPCIDIRDAGGTNTATINLKSDGTINSAAIDAFIVAHGAASVTKVYDQVGTNHMTQATFATMPVLTANAIGTSYAMTFAGAQALGGTTFTSTQPQSYSIITRRTGALTSFNAAFSSDAGGGIQIGFNNSANTGLIYAGTVAAISSGNITDSQFWAMNIALNNASTIWQFNALTGTAAPSGNSPNGVPAIGADIPAGTGNPLTGDVMEVGFIDSVAINGTQAGQLNTNQHAAYGGW